MRATASVDFKEVGIIFAAFDTPDRLLFYPVRAISLAHVRATALNFTYSPYIGAILFVLAQRQDTINCQ